MSEFTVVSWNTLLDKRYPQVDRVDSIAATLQQLDDKRPIDVLGLMEIEATDELHHGELLASQLFGNQGSWVAHSRRSLGEHIGMAGPEVCDVEVINLGHKKKAVLTMLADVAVVAIHLRRQPKHIPPSPEQVEQINVLLERLEQEEKAVIMGDFNCVRLQKPRRMLGAVGFSSAFPSLNPLTPRTVPVGGFDKILSSKRKIGAKLTGGGVNVDDIYVKNIEVVDSGVAVGESDHALVWATLNDPKI